MTSHALNALELIRGDEDPTDSRMSIMEAVARHAGITDRNEFGESNWLATASIVLGCFFSQWSNDLDDEPRQRLKPYVPRLVGTRADDALERARLWSVRDWYVRTMLPVWLEVSGFSAPAAALRAEKPLSCDADATRVSAQVDELATPIRSLFLEQREKAGLMVWLTTARTAGNAVNSAGGGAGRDTVASTLYERRRGWPPEDVWEEMKHTVYSAAAQCAELVALAAREQQAEASERLGRATAECEASAHRLIEQLLGAR